MKRKIRSASVLFFATAILLCNMAGGADGGPAGTFSWQDTDGEYLDLLFDGKKVTRYMYAYDTSTEQRTFETYKPFHHVYDAEGNLLTNGPDGSTAYPKKGILYPHHRGILIGWNKLTFEGGEIVVNRDSLDQNNASISRKEHARFNLRNGAWYVTDLSSNNASFVQLRKTTPIADGTALVFGRKVFTFHCRS